MRVEKQRAKNGNQYHRYVFSKKKCKKCPMKDQCRVGKGKSQAYSITQVSEKNSARLEFEASERFQVRMKLWHRIEEKNGELKEAHGLRRADSTGLFAMQLQMYFTAFVANAKRDREVIWRLSQSLCKPPNWCKIKLLSLEVLSWQEKTKAHKKQQ